MPKRKFARDEWKDEMLNPVGPTTPPPEVNLVTELLKAMSDPKAGKAYLEKITDTHAAVAKAKAAELNRLQAEHEDRLAQTAHDAAGSLARDRASFDAECRKREAELKARERQVAEREAAAEAAHKAADAVKADYARRIQRVSAAATETA